jgi:uncharacterized DUF497 family protein
VQYNFEWDPAKARQNARKHGVSFERAAQVFVDPLMISIYDEEHSVDEERWATLGMDKNNVLLVVVHTFQELDPENATVRIISARKPTRQEGKQYHERKGL